MTPLRPIPSGVQLDWRGSEALPLPAGAGELVAIPAVGGIAYDRWQRGGIEVRFNAGIDRVRIAGRGHSTELKKLFQQHAVPPWLRSRVPLVFQDDALLAVADLCVCEPFAAPEDAPGILLEWRRSARGDELSDSPDS
jgi:tRNA(Ile)-lysidine synthase